MQNVMTELILIFIGIFCSTVLLDLMIFVVRQFYTVHILREPTHLFPIPKAAELSQASLELCGLFLMALIIVTSVVVAGVQFLLKIFQGLLT